MHPGAKYLGYAQKVLLDEIENKKDNSKKRERGLKQIDNSHTSSVHEAGLTSREIRGIKGGKEEGEEYKKKRRKDE